LRFDQATRHFYGLPTYTERGTLTIVLTATDTSGATVSDTFMVTVQPVTDTNLMAGDDQTNRLRGNRQNDLLVGMGGDDSLQGGGGGDVLDGGTGNDTLKAGSGGDTLYGGEGNDLLIGARGSDIYLFGYGDGQDIVQGADNSDTILLLVNPQDVVFVHEGNNLVIRLRDTADTLTLLNWYKGDRNRVAFIAVIDGQRLFPPD
ncbi:MAG TPA: putative Ig domain-containing protein, partial [Candidatus Saccharimonadales bacterium]|nr:putative Ig domain-containing protein [Candidatus Saccharimonadales bacterium]